MMTASTMLMSVMLMMVMVSLHGSTCKNKYYSTINTIHCCGDTAYLYTYMHIKQKFASNFKNYKQDKWHTSVPSVNH